jgi:hypothetical protein
MTDPIAFFDPQEKGFYWAQPTKITAPTIVDVEPLALYTQRTWVGLTDDEVENLCLAVGTEPIEVRLIEAKLKEKNGC